MKDLLVQRTSSDANTLQSLKNSKSSNTAVPHRRPLTAAQQQVELEKKKAFLRKHPVSSQFLFEPCKLWELIVRHRFRLEKTFIEAIEREGLNIDSTTAQDSEDGGVNDTTSDEVHSYEDLRLTFDGYREVAYSILFRTDINSEGTTDEKNESNTMKTQSAGNDYTEDEKENLFFRHPFLSPKTFLMFERSQQEVPIDVLERWSHTLKEKRELVQGNRSSDDVENQLKKLDTSKLKVIIPDTIAAVPLYAYVAKKMLLFRIRVMLELVASVPPPCLRVEDATPQLRCAPSLSSPLSNGLSQEDVEAFIAKLVPNLRVVRDMPEWLLPYYLCHASRKIMFMLDPRGQGAISIESMMTSEVFSELLRMYESEPKDANVVFPHNCLIDVAPSDLRGFCETIPTNSSSDGDDEAATLKHRAYLSDKLNSLSTLPEDLPTLPDWVTKFEERGDEDAALRGQVVSYEGEGNILDGVYIIQFTCPFDLRKSIEELESENDTAGDEGLSPASSNVSSSSKSYRYQFNAVVPRKFLRWCPNSSEYIQHELLGTDNWFSLPLMHRIYEHFVSLDNDSDGELTLEEFAEYTSASFTPLAVQRIFEIHVPSSGPSHVMNMKHI